MEAIEIKNLHKTFKSLHKKQMAIDGINLSIKKGEIFGFLGPNGAGKSTTMKIMMNFIKADEGKVLINGLYSTDIKCRYEIGFLPENPSFVDNLTGMDILMFSCAMHNINKNEAKSLSEDMIDLVGLESSAAKRVRGYSKGMIQRLGFAASIIHKPKILILDEPMGGVDPVGRYLFKQIIKKLHEEGTTIFFSSHIIPDIEDICTKAAIINKGRIIRTIGLNQIKQLSASSYKIIFLDDKNIRKISDSCYIGDNLCSVTCKTDDLESKLHSITALNLKIISVDSEKKDLESIFIQDITN